MPPTNTRGKNDYRLRAWCTAKSKCHWKKTPTMKESSNGQAHRASRPKTTLRRFTFTLNTRKTRWEKRQSDGCSTLSAEIEICSLAVSASIKNGRTKIGVKNRKNEVLTRWFAVFLPYTATVSNPRSCSWIEVWPCIHKTVLDRQGDPKQKHCHRLRQSKLHGSAIPCKLLNEDGRRCDFANTEHELRDQVIHNKNIATISEPRFCLWKKVWSFTHKNVFERQGDTH